MCQRSDQTWTLYWKMRGKQLLEEAATERFSTWPWATHQTALKRVLFIIVVWLSMDSGVCQSVCLLPPPPLCHVSRPWAVCTMHSVVRALWALGHAERMLMSHPFYSRVALRGSVSCSGVSKWKTMPQDKLFSFYPHLLRVQRLLSHWHHYNSRHTQEEARVHWMICKIQYLAWSFPGIIESQTSLGWKAP